MDIFFCDLCGARVTDADLRAGHGTRRRLDVICGTCLEQGHGQEWLSARAGVKPAVAAAVAAAMPDTPAPSSSAAVLDQARDRARTLEQEEEAQRVVPQSVTADDTDVASAPVDHVATTRVPNEIAAPDLASAAGTFARLGGTPLASSSSPEMRDDLIDDVEKDLPAGITPTPAPAVSPFAFDHKTDKADAAKSPSEVREPKNSSGMRKSPSGVRSKPGSASSVRPSSAPSAKSGKGGTSGKISKRRPAADDSGRKILFYTGISAAVMLLLLGGFVLFKSTQKKSGGTITTSPLVELRESVIKTKEFAVSALKTKEPAKLKQARSMIEQCGEKVMGFEAVAKAQKPPWTDEQIETSVDQLNWPGLNSLRLMINQELVKQGAQ